MNSKYINYAIGTLVFLVSLIVGLQTVQPSVPFWDCGEFIASAYGMQVPHPPGTPFFLILGRIFAMLPIDLNIGLKVNMISVVSSAFAILFLYLIVVKLINNARKISQNENSLFENILTFISAAIGALSLSFSDTFWFNAVEAEVYALATFLMAFAVYLVLVWFEKAEEEGSDRYIYFIAYLMGLSTGVHLMSLLAIPSIIMLIYFKKYITDEKILKQSGYFLLIHSVLLLGIAIALWTTFTNTVAPSLDEYRATDKRFIFIFLGISVVFIGVFFKKLFNKNSIYFPIVFGGLGLVLVYPIIVKYVPNVLQAVGTDNSFIDIFIFTLFFVATIGGSFWAKKKGLELVRVLLLSFAFVLIGFTTYTMIIIRANQNTPINLNNPKTFNGFMSYLNREQYGEAPVFRRRYSAEPMHQEMYTKYSSDFDFFVNYQFQHMVTRYLLINYIGRESTEQDTGIDFNQLWGIPFLLGLLGIYWHFRKDWKMASVFMLLFMMLGYIMAIYFNSQEPQPRERDYFYVGAYFVFSIWVGLGVRGLIEMIQDVKQLSKSYKVLAISTAIAAFILVPVNMFIKNYPSHDRSNNYLPWDYAYNLLQSVAPNAILFTNGDNDTFPLWYLQDVEGIRRDVRIANLSLLNTPWYIDQLKNQSPYGAMKVKFALTDDEIAQLSPSRWEEITVSIDVPKELNLDSNSLNDAKIEKIKSGNEIKTSKNTNSVWEKVDKIVWKMKPTLNYGTIQAVRAQDIAVLDIVKSFNWERPIYFSVTCADDARIGMDNYMKMEGLAYRLVPERSENDLIFIDEPIMKAQLFDSNPEEYSANYRPGLKFRGLSDESVFFNSSEMRLVQNYRNSFIRLALYYLYVEKNNEMVTKTLDKMEHYIPRKRIELDYRLLFDVAGIYRQVGNYNKYNEISKEIEKLAWKMIETNPNNLTNTYNPYRLLFEIYENTNQYEKALKVVDKLEKLIPGDQTVDGLRKKFTALKNNE